MPGHFWVSLEKQTNHSSWAGCLWLPKSSLGVAILDLFREWQGWVTFPAGLGGGVTQGRRSLNMDVPSRSLASISVVSRGLQGAELEVPRSSPRPSQIIKNNFFLPASVYFVCLCGIKPCSMTVVGRVSSSSLYGAEAMD